MDWSGVIHFSSKTMETRDFGEIDTTPNGPKLMTGLTMISKPLPSTVAWPKAIVSSEEIDALLHGLFPPNLTPLIANPCRPEVWAELAWPDSGELSPNAAETDLN